MFDWNSLIDYDYTRFLSFEESKQYLFQVQNYDNTIKFSALNDLALVVTHSIHKT